MARMLLAPSKLIFHPKLTESLGFLKVDLVSFGKCKEFFAPRVYHVHLIPRCPLFVGV